MLITKNGCAFGCNCLIVVRETQKSFSNRHYPSLNKYWRARDDEGRSTALLQYQGLFSRVLLNMQ